MNEEEAEGEEPDGIQSTKVRLHKSFSFAASKSNVINGDDDGFVTVGKNNKPIGEQSNVKQGDVQNRNLSGNYLQSNYKENQNSFRHNSSNLRQNFGRQGPNSYVDKKKPLMEPSSSKFVVKKNQVDLSNFKPKVLVRGSGSYGSIDGVLGENVPVANSFQNWRLMEWRIRKNLFEAAMDWSLHEMYFFYQNYHKYGLGPSFDDDDVQTKEGGMADEMRPEYVDGCSQDQGNCVASDAILFPMIKLFSWNIKGLNNSPNQKQVIDLLHEVFIHREYSEEIKPWVPIKKFPNTPMDDDLFTYEVEVANIPCDSKIDDDSKHEADDDMGYDPSDVAFTEWLGSKGNDEVEITDEESSDDMNEVAEVFKIDTNLFNFETPMCKAFKEFNYLLQIDPDLLTKDIEGFKTYEDYKNDWIYEWNKDVPWVNEKAWTNAGDDGYCNGGNLTETYIIRNQLHYQDYEWYEALEDSELKDEALRNKAIMEGFINDGGGGSRYKQERRWNIYTNYDDAYEINHEDNEREELCEVHELPVCNIRRHMMIKYSFNNDEEYVAIKEYEYEELTITREEACRAYQEIFWIMDEGWMVTRAE
ncbi:hypothetical protein Tco_1143100 [Tanacetum coccineum]